MASKCGRFMNRTSLSSLKSSINFATKSASKSSASPLPRSTTSSAIPRFNFSRIPTELGAAHSMMPLHSAVALARMTSCLSTSSRSCRSLSQGTLCRTSPDL